MPKAKEPMALFADLFKELPVDTAALETAYKSVAELNEKLAASAIKAASAAQDISADWTKGALLQAGQLTSAKADPSDYVKVAADVAAERSEATIKSLTAFADIAKTCQTETVELLTKAGKELNEDAAKTVKEATQKASTAAKKLAAAA